MEIYAKGQLSFLILNCLLERDFYGLDIISEIKSRSNGKIDLKKPSVYSNLTRMEKQGQVSSYMRSSDLGPNRRYYSITEKGRNTYQMLKSEFERNHFDVFQAFSDEDSSEKDTLVEANFSANSNQEERSIIDERALSSEHENTDINNLEANFITENTSSEDEITEFFDFSSLENSSKTDDSNINSNPTISVSDDSSTQPLNQPQPINQRSIFEGMRETALIANTASKEETNIVLSEKDALSKNMSSSQNHSSLESNVMMQSPIIQNLNTETVPLQTASFTEASSKSVLQNENSVKTEKKNDARFLTNSDTMDPDYNKRIYDITKDIGRYRKKRSFAEDQIALTLGEEPLQVAEERRQQHLENFKSSLIANKGKFSDSTAEAQFNRYRAKETSALTKESSPSKEEVKVNETKEVHNDGVFINYRVDVADALKPKKIEPPRLKIITESKVGLPAPKRDTTIDPSHKEIISRLYSKSKGSENELVDDSEALYDYADLQDYYQTQKIMFKPYERDTVVAKHNTNKLNLIVSITTFLILCLTSGILYAILANLGFTNDNTNFLYILLPCIYLVDVAVKWYAAARYTSWEPKPMLSQWILWLITLFSIGVVFGLNFIFGMEVGGMMQFATTLILPILLILVLLPVRYYVKRISYIKFWK